MENYLVLGGCGYIGSNIGDRLLRNSVNLVVVDDLSTGYQNRIPKSVSFYKLNTRDFSSLHEIVVKHRITTVIHLAAKKQARESMRKPLEYWDENVGSTLSLLRAIRNSEVRTILFSSSCSVYGNSGLTTLKTEFSPQSVYARTKLTSEQILIDCMHELGYRVGILRYFNVIGAGNFYNSGDRASEAVIPNFIKNVLENEPIKIFGNQYNTIDGTAVRDYVDVRDLSEAHIKVAQFLNQGDESQFECLVSTGNPKSVLEVATEVMMQIGKKVDITYVDSSSCDPAEVWSQVDVQLFNLGWVPNHNFRESVKSQILQSNGYLNTGKDVRE